MNSHVCVNICLRYRAALIITSPLSLSLVSILCGLFSFSVSQNNIEFGHTVCSVCTGERERERGLKGERGLCPINLPHMVDLQMTDP